MNTLILIPTRQCNLRCSYCPTVKDDWPSLAIHDALRAIDDFIDRYGSGNLKLFGGEPLLMPDLVRAVIKAASARDPIQRVVLCTNGLGLDDSWLREFAAMKKVTIALSIDGRPEDHRRFRRALPGVADSYDHILSLLPVIAAAPRLVVTQVIPPATAADGVANFEHLLSLGFWRFKFLPAFYVRWRQDQLASLRTTFQGIARIVQSRWRNRQPLYVRNLFNWAPHPTFNAALTLDANGGYYAGDAGLIDLPEPVRDEIRVGSLDAPPSRDDVAAGMQRAERLLPTLFSRGVWESTLQADAELTAFCESLYPAFVQWRSLRRSVRAQHLKEAS